jgi:hypothetical protein
MPIQQIEAIVLNRVTPFLAACLALILSLYRALAFIALILGCSFGFGGSTIF